ncbi:retron-type reverse transcriptase [Thiohalobacter thiocyanaticus]|uniref:Retron-type reverse transcriptase n=1 Tax=Thiohalobacter thiocyanaticus TaxID=585455 RepID=A0A1Z4VSK2_9GAMM|nr:reverse transcriptase domain-containing protein [Thiohalobacter thiocyanaticus]BAZ94610.1 retron-type reverse transcriptase [Thiohalobacter thiocyanaticus]
MKLIADKYRKLKPTLEHLADSVVMAQAWKKTHAYMRTHNWYADTLALDISALGLEANAKSWADDIRLVDVCPYPVELIPAAKSEKWVIDEKHGWLAESRLDDEAAKVRLNKPPIRPLAHLSIRDQTWATAAMLCLADVVETAQGDCDNSNPFEARNNKVYSYGNRLMCDWRDDQAWFRWGNGETYRKFFTDYQAFLKRPVAIGRSVALNQTDEEHVFIVSLDLSKFYDCIDRKLLSERLQKLAREFYEEELDSEFWSALGRIFDWRWRDKDHQVAESLSVKLGNGLPQGLVAAGFFANAYLHEFDAAIGKQIGKSLPNNTGVVLHDYCRYVDDIRLVFSLDVDIDSEFLGDKVNHWVCEKLHKFGGESLELNEGKTQVTTLSDLDNKGTLSERIRSLQEDISGPADRDTLDSVMGVLEGLLTLKTDDIPVMTEMTKDNALLKLAKFDHDVRHDTLKRFAANRLEAVMRNKRKIAGEVLDTGVTPLDNESELLAKKLIWAWMQDPSLALVLRKALEIFPSPLLAEPVFEAIFRRTNFGGGDSDAITAAQAEYLLADLFRSCVDFHGYFQRIDYPSTSDPDAMLDLATRYAQRTIAATSVPGFVERQALLLLAVMQKPVRRQESDGSIQRMLHTILAGSAMKLHRQNLALYEVAAQITGNNDSVASLLAEQMDVVDLPLKRRVLEDFALRGGDFWISLWRRLKRQKTNKELLDEFQWAIPVTSGGVPSPNVQQRLSKIIVSDNNGFIHEAGLLKLVLALIDGIRCDRLALGIAPDKLIIGQVQAKKSDWAELWRPEVSLKSTAKSIHNTDPRFDTPSWINSEISDSAEIYWIGMILRAAVVGSNDFTSNRWKKSKIVGYKGLRTGWFKRRMGMMHAPESLVGEYATVTDWVAELIRKCLQWPGFESTHVVHDDIRLIEDLDSLQASVETRLGVLNDTYCYASDMPGLITNVQRPRESAAREFRLVTVQQLLPKGSDFSKADPELNSTLIKNTNREHVARLCRITYKTLAAKIHADNNGDRPFSDLIVFPELGVHLDDLDLLKQLADKTRSMILAGMVFTERNGKLVNLARWLIPDYRITGRQWIVRDQGKLFPTDNEIDLGVSPERPCQHIIEVDGFDEGPFRITASICYDATDLKLASDLKGKSELFVILAHNKDVTTFDTMASALHYHMYQHVALVNKGEFGGSTIQAPYKQPYERLISHAHGTDQISINVADLDLAAFKRKASTKLKEIKTQPAG